MLKKSPKVVENDRVGEGSSNPMFIFDRSVKNGF
jgi:hypothetical protein